MRKTPFAFVLAVCIALLVPAFPADAQDRPAAPGTAAPGTEEERQRRIQALEEKVKVLTDRKSVV